MKVSFTKYQLDEIAFKLGVIVEEPGLQNSYDLTVVEADDLLHLFSNAKPGVVEFDEKYADVLIGELENCIDIASDNLSSGDDAQRGRLRSWKNAIAKIEAAKSAT